jgi:hypothetical protein
VHRQAHFRQCRAELATDELRHGEMPPRAGLRVDRES